MVVADVVAPQEVVAAVAVGVDVADSSRQVAEGAVVAGAVVVEAVLVVAADAEEREVAVRR